MNKYVLQVLRIFKQCFIQAWQQIVSRPFHVILISLMLFSALVIPNGLFSLLTNFDEALAQWQTDQGMVVFLGDHVTSQQASRLLDECDGSIVRACELITPKQGRRFFEEKTQMGALFKVLDQNPLPYVLQVHFRDVEPKAMETLYVHFSKHDFVDSIDYDPQWIFRLQQIRSLLANCALGLVVVLWSSAFFVLVLMSTMMVRDDELALRLYWQLGASPIAVLLPYGIASLIIGGFAVITAVLGMWLGGEWLQSTFVELLASYGVTIEFHQEKPLFWDRLVWMIPVMCAIVALFSAFFSWKRLLKGT